MTCGAAAALLSLAIGFLLGRPTGIALGRLNEQRATTAAPAADLLERMAKLRRRAALSSRLAAGLLGVAVLSMGVLNTVAESGAASTIDWVMPANLPM